KTALEKTNFPSASLFGSRYPLHSSSVTDTPIFHRKGPFTTFSLSGSRTTVGKVSSSLSSKSLVCIFNDFVAKRYYSTEVTKKQDEDALPPKFQKLVDQAPKHCVNTDEYILE